MPKRRTRIIHGKRWLFRKKPPSEQKRPPHEYKLRAIKNELTGTIDPVNSS